MPKVGEGWISETELFYKISDYFKEDEVVHHASPKWLGRQHLDIYFPKLNIGIEYQGLSITNLLTFLVDKKLLRKPKKEIKEKNNFVRNITAC